MKLMRTIAGAVTATAMLLMPVSTVFAGYYPTDPSVRPTYTCNASGTACPGADHVQFDSFTNNPAVGDERPFLAGALNGKGGVQDRLQVHDGDTIVVRAYVHNNADATKMGGEAKTLAKNVMFKAIVPTQSNTDMNLVGFISADNASPRSINDTMSVYGASAFTLQYVAGSAQFVNKPDGVNAKTVKLSDSIVGSGASLGNIYGCFAYSGYVTYTVKVHMPTKPQPKQIQVCELDTKKIVTINESDFNSSKYSTDLTKCQPTPPTTTTPSTPSELPNTGAGNVIGIFAASVVAGTIIGRLFLSRKAARR